MENTEIITKKDNRIIVDIPIAKLFVKKGEDFALNPQAEEGIVKLREAIEFLTTLENSLKEAVAQKLLEINPNSRGIVGDRVKMIYRAYGGKYRFDWDKKSIVDPFLKLKTVYSVDSEKVEKYLKEVGELPDGVYETDRESKLSISINKDDEISKQLIYFEKENGD